MGIGLMTKDTMLFFGFGLAVALLATSERRQFLTVWPWAAGLIAFAIMLPNLIWQIQHDWPFIQHMKKLNEHQLSQVTPQQFLVGLFLICLPALPVWIAGLVYFFSEQGKAFRIFGWMVVIIFIAMLALKAKSYYIAPVYPWLFAAGGVQLEAWLEKQSWPKPVLVTAMSLLGAVLLPYGVPILPIETFVEYMRLVPITTARIATQAALKTCRPITPICSDGKKKCKASPKCIMPFRLTSSSIAAFWPPTTARLERLIFMAKNTDCRTPSAAMPVIGFGRQPTIPKLRLPLPLVMQKAA